MMTVNSYHHGWPIVYMRNVGWVYKDTLEQVAHAVDRPCPRCKRTPTADGHDACLGKLPGVSSACCGHGVTEPIRIKES